MLSDVRQAVRALRASGGFTAVAALTLGVGIGGNVLLFSMVRHVVLSPLPYSASERLVEIDQWQEGPEGGGDNVSYPNFADWRREARATEGLAAFVTSTLTVSGRGEPFVVDSASVSGDLFLTLGVTAADGRTLSAADDALGAPKVAVLHRSLAERLFESEPALGQPLRLDDEPYTVVGLMPDDFVFPIGPRPPQVWTPLLTHSLLARNREGRSANLLSVIGRLRPGTSLEQAQAEMRQIASALERQYPDTNAGSGARTRPYRESLVGTAKAPLYLLMAAVVGVLLIACANLAGLLLVRGVARQREIAVRASLGAGRARIVRQLLVESLLIAGLGGGLGLLLAQWGLATLASTRPVDLPRLATVGLDGPVVAFALVLSTLTSLLFGLLPAWQAAGVSTSGLLGGAFTRGSSGRAQARLRQAIVVAEVALALVLVLGGGLLLRSFDALRSVDPGFRVERLLAGSVSLPRARYPDGAARMRFVDRVLEELRATAGIQAAASVFPLPLSDSAIGLSFEIAGRPVASRADRPTAQYFAASPGYFGLLAIPLLRGRLFDERDVASAPKVMVVSETFARRHFPEGEPLGSRVTIGLNDATVEIVGVVGDVKRDGLDAAAAPQMYTAFAQMPWPFFEVVVKTTGPAQAAASSLRGAVARIDGTQAASDVRTLDDALGRSVARPRFVALLLGAFAGLALLLASLGIYGVMAYSVGQRTREIGIRMALGAEPASVRRMVLRQGWGLALAGSALGLLAAPGLTRLLESQLFGIGAHDPLTWAVTLTTLLGTATVASYLPARRATRTDPAAALRAD